MRIATVITRLEGGAGALALRARGRVVAICLAAVLGGALGNLSDRLFRSPGLGRGPVVDWIHVAGRPGSFNLSDLAIQLGVVVALVAVFVTERGKRGQRNQQAADPRPAE